LCFLALQLHADFSFRESLQPPFKKPGLAGGLVRRNLRQAAREALEIPGLFKRAIHSWRTDFQDIAGPGTSSSTSRITLNCWLTRWQSA